MARRRRSSFLLLWYEHLDAQIKDNVNDCLERVQIIRILVMASPKK